MSYAPVSTMDFVNLILGTFPFILKLSYNLIQHVLHPSDSEANTWNSTMDLVLSDEIVWEEDKHDGCAEIIFH